VLAAFGECASARQQSEDLAASPTHNEAPAAWKEAPASHDSPNGAPVTRETTSRAPTARKEARGWREIPKGTPVAHENRKGTPAAHESQQSASAVRENQKNESPGARERRALRDKLNAGLVGIVFGGMDDADFSEAVDLGEVIKNPDIKIMSAAGNGAKETVTDLLFARGIDVGIVQTDVLSTLKQKPPFPDVEKFLQYIANLYDQEIHILARDDIHSLIDLRDKRVNFGTYESGSYTSATRIFEALGITVQSTIYPQPLGLEKLRRGEIAAMVYTAGKPARLFQTVKPREALHFLSVPTTDALRQSYKQAELDAHDYPDLIEKDQSIATLSVGTVLAVYNWPPNSERRRKIENFVQAFFRQMDELRFPPHHPKWREVDIDKSVPGWTRFASAEQWIAGEHAGNREDSGKSGSTQAPGTNAPPSAGSDEGAPTSTLDSEQREALFRGFLEYQKNQKQTLFADFQAYLKAHSSPRFP
jgi:TRAP-type uncharacterized transport system substrate-binding protein